MATEAVPAEKRTLFVSGGHEFSRRQGNEALRDYMLALTGKESPRVCLLPTASGDPADQISDFRRSLGESACEVSEVSLFRLEASTTALRDRLLLQDLIYAGGGSMLNLLAIWTAHGLERIMIDAWERGVVICGQSAGAMCWFERGISRSFGEAAPVKGIGLLPGSLCVHYHGDPERRAAFLNGVCRSFPRATDWTTRPACCSAAPSAPRPWSRGTARASGRSHPTARGGRSKRSCHLGGCSTRARQSTTPPPTWPNSARSGPCAIGADQVSRVGRHLA